MTIRERTRDVMKTMLETFEERGAVYKDDYVDFARLLTVLYPGGPRIKSEMEWIKFDFLCRILGKVTRFTASGMTHQDSIHDIAVYAAMLEAALLEEKG